MDSHMAERRSPDSNSADAFHEQIAAPIVREKRIVTPVLTDDELPSMDISEDILKEIPDSIVEAELAPIDYVKGRSRRPFIIGGIVGAIVLVGLVVYVNKDAIVALDPLNHADAIPGGTDNSLTSTTSRVYTDGYFRFSFPTSWVIGTGNAYTTAATKGYQITLKSPDYIEADAYNNIAQKGAIINVQSNELTDEMRKNADSGYYDDSSYTKIKVDGAQAYTNESNSSGLVTKTMTLIDSAHSKSYSVAITYADTANSGDYVPAFTKIIDTFKRP